MLTAFKRETYAQRHSKHLLLIAEGKTPEIDANTQKQLLTLLSIDGVTEITPDFHQKYLYKYAYYCLDDRHKANPDYTDLANNGET
ncbi:MAG TPA: hypothetical protein PLD88_03965, partial [Candidatus Berkiella sp.]|nr:hypothetical protein [Candidatus Berkiella sp.]